MEDMVEFYRKRDGSAYIQLCIPTKEDPFKTISLYVVDFGVSDNIYVCELPDGFVVEERK